MNCPSCGAFIDMSYRACPNCGTVLATLSMTREESPNIQQLPKTCRPHIWVCEECGELYTDAGGDARPICEECGEVLSALQVFHSRVRGAGVKADLDLGLTLLLEAQS